MSKEKAIRSKQKECFLDGRARKPHSRTRQTLRRSFEEAQPGPSHPVQQVYVHSATPY